MPKVTIDNNRGLVQEGGSGLVVNSAITVGAEGALGVAYGTSTTMVESGANDVAISITQPAGTVLVDAGCVLTAATVGSGNSNVKFGTADDGAEICAAAAFISSGVGAIGSAISVASGATGEGAAALSFVADSPLYSSTSRTIYFRSENSATLTAGTIRPWIAFMKV